MADLAREVQRHRRVDRNDVGIRSVSGLRGTLLGSFRPLGPAVGLMSALATGGDPLHLSLVFNIDHTNAMAYANAARNLLAGPAGPALSPHRPA